MNYPTSIKKKHGMLLMFERDRHGVSGSARLLSRMPYCLVDLMDHIRRITIHRQWSLYPKNEWGSATHCWNQSVMTSSWYCFCFGVNDFGTICEHSFRIRRSPTIINRAVSLLIPSVSAMYWCEIRRFVASSSSTHFTFSLLCVEMSLTEFGSSSSDSCPSL